MVLYKASLFSSLAFFLVALLAGLSMAAVYIFVVYAGVAAVGYQVMRTGLAQIAAAEEDRGRGRAALQHRRPHAE